MQGPVPVNSTLEIITIGKYFYNEDHEVHEEQSLDLFMAFMSFMVKKTIRKNKAQHLHASKGRFNQQEKASLYGQETAS